VHQANRVDSQHGEGWEEGECEGADWLDRTKCQEPEYFPGPLSFAPLSDFRSACCGAKARQNFLAKKEE
jgi:hypothetical protein